MIVYVRAFGIVQPVLGERRLAIEMPGGASIQEVLEILAARYYTDRKEEIWDAERHAFQIPVIVMTGGRDVFDYSRPLEDEQEIMLVAPMAGG